MQKHMFRSPWRDSVFGGFDQVPFFLFYIFCLMICNLLIYGTIYSTLYNKLLQAVTLFVVSWIATKCLYWNHNVMNMKRILHINFIQIYSWHQIIISSKYIESCCVISLPKYHSEPQTGRDRSDACSIGPIPVRFWHFMACTQVGKPGLQTHVMIFSGNISVAGVEGSILLPNDLTPTESTPAKAAVRAGRYGWYE